jgi:ATP-dependent DNA helicase RecG
MAQLNLVFPKHYVLLSPDEIYEGADQSLLSRLDEDRRVERKPSGVHGKELGEYLSMLDEDRRVERKPSGVHGKELGEYLSMWANTVPDGGIIVVGMDDDGQFSGCHNLDSNQINALEKANHIYAPEARTESKRVGVISKRGEPSFVLVFRVRYREDKVVRTVSGHAFIRRGDEKHELSDSEIRELEIDRHEIDIEREPVDLKYPEDFDSDLVRRFVEGVRRVHQPTQQYEDFEVLQQRRLGTVKNGSFVPNVACALAFARDPITIIPGCQIKFLRIDGETEQSGDRYNVIKTEIIEGPVPRLLQEAAKVLASQLRDFSRLGNDGIFYSAPEYPTDAWYEALVNACVHRSYGIKKMNIFVKMFDDKLVIESPGGFPPLVTPENIYTMHHPRNPTLMRAMFYLGVVKEHAEGTKRMRETMQNMNLPDPHFMQTESGPGFSQVRVTLRNHIKQRKVWVDTDVSIALGEALARNLTAEEKRILNFVAEHGKINVVQCHRLIPSLAKWHSAKKMLQRLVDNGLLKRNHSCTVERDSRSHYVLPDAFRGAKNGAETKKTPRTR